MATVSIVIPTYNRAGYLSQAIASTLAQPLDDLEVVVVDDGSTDNTREVVQAFGSDARLVCVYQDNQGATAAFNRGIRESTGDYLGILGSDDWYLPNGLVPLANELDRRPDLGLAAGGYIFVDERGHKLLDATPRHDYPRLDLETWLMACPVLFQAALIRRSWVDRMGGVATGLQDWDLGLRLARAGCAMAWVEQAVFAYRMHPSQSVRDAGLMRREALAVLDSFFAAPDVPPIALAHKDAAYANAYLKGAVAAYAAGCVVEAQDDLERACRLAPRLAAERGQALFDLFVARATHPLTPDADAYLGTIFAHLPASLAALRARRREAVAAAAMVACYRAHSERDWPRVRRMLLRAVVHHPAWLGNRGVLSIARRALGRGVAGRRAHA